MLILLVVVFVCLFICFVIAVKCFFQALNEYTASYTQGTWSNWVTCVLLFVAQAASGLSILIEYMDMCSAMHLGSTEITYWYGLEVEKHYALLILDFTITNTPGWITIYSAKLLNHVWPVFDNADMLDLDFGSKLCWRKPTLWYGYYYCFWRSYMDQVSMHIVSIQVSLNAYHQYMRAASSFCLWWLQNWNSWIWCLG